jgi:hypothetical protein
LRSWDLVEAFLEARSWCTALKAWAKGEGYPEATLLADGLSQLCVEMRKVLGTTSVGDMPPYILDSEAAERIAGCINAAEKLYRLTLSPAAIHLARAARELLERVK